MRPPATAASIPASVTMKSMSTSCGWGTMVAIRDSSKASPTASGFGCERGERAIEIPAAVAEPIALRADAERRDQQGVGSE